jgi:hypothetical protein
MRWGGAPCSVEGDWIAGSVQDLVGAAEGEEAVDRPRR